MMSEEGSEADPIRTVAVLTERHRTCLRLVWQHLSSKQIALELGISHHTVDDYLKDAARRLGVETRIDAARILAEAEGAGPPQWLVPQAPGIVGAGQFATIDPSHSGGAHPSPEHAVREMQAAFEVDLVSAAESRKASPRGGDRYDLSVPMRLAIAALIAIAAPMLLGALFGALGLVLTVRRALGY